MALLDYEGLAYFKEKLESEIVDKTKIVFADCTSITSTNVGTYVRRLINVNVPSGYTPVTNDYLMVKFPNTDEPFNETQEYMIHYNYKGGTYTADGFVKGLGTASDYDTGTVIFEANCSHLFRYDENGDWWISSGFRIENLSHIVKVQDVQPTEQGNKIWIRETPGDEIQVPTYTEFIEAEKKRLLHSESIENTAQTIIFDQQTGNISQILHKHNEDVIRADVFIFDPNLITETRTLYTGETLTFETNTNTLTTTVTYVANGG